MNAADRETLRLSLLRHLEPRTGKFGLQAPLLTSFVRNEGLRVTVNDVRAECLYLVDKGLIEETTKAVSPENTAWRITAAGRDFVAKNEAES